MVAIAADAISVLKTRVKVSGGASGEGVSGNIIRMTEQTP